MSLIVFSVRICALSFQRFETVFLFPQHLESPRCKIFALAATCFQSNVFSLKNYLLFLFKHHGSDLLFKPVFNVSSVKDRRQISLNALKPFSFLNNSKVFHMTSLFWQPFVFKVINVSTLKNRILFYKHHGISLLLKYVSLKVSSLKTDVSLSRLKCLLFP